ncbi:MAG: hypothetical protein J6R68_06145 [Clostridia bacterium]|nr:hypothetical protein [Clostridia bacterium]MBO7288608.1 hypothetical protein [Clostridia bacterium]
MADDMTDKLKDILNNPDIMNMLSSLSGGGNERNDVSSDSGDIASSVKSVLSNLGSENDKRVNLLYALKPYMRGRRADSLDRAIKMIKLTKLSSILKDL